MIFSFLSLVSQSLFKFSCIPEVGLACFYSQYWCLECIGKRCRDVCIRNGTDKFSIVANDYYCSSHLICIDRMRGGNAKHTLCAEDHERFAEVFCIHLWFISYISTSITQLFTCPENLSSDMLIVSTPPSVCVLVWLCMSVMILCWIMCAHVGISSSLSVMARQNTHKPNSWDHQVT